ncbi:ABC transporter ATP-binding protein [Heliophilum fasciatum]|nr:ABC transporter ATP-binding protein [Heliophilum fasciatum]MCW2279195.1 simple sugar transport system ATP-binding protein [Heliophilum fasciatum]
MVEMIGITKRFPGIVANDQISFAVRPGEIHALLGENGAGKSTLMSILTGLYRPDEGEIRLRGQQVHLQSPRDAVQRGIGMVHQHFKLVNSFTVAENILLGLQDGTGEVYQLHEINKKIEACSREYGLQLDPQAKIWQLSVGEQQRAEIIKLLYRGADLLILDEPTAVLTPQEATELYKTLRRMAELGKSVIVISHKLSEVLEHTDAITVLRSGRSVGTVATSGTSEQELTQMMVGRMLCPVLDKANVMPGKPVLTLENVTALGDRGLPALKEVTLTVNGGEILGIAGVAGNGQKELAEVIAGLRAIESGTKWINSVDHTGDTPQAAIHAGVSYIPEDRLGTGLVPNLNAVENILLKMYQKMPGWRINWSQAARDTTAIIKQHDIKIAHLDAPVKMLSGGNLQKLLLGREIFHHPELIVAMYPMRGLDIGAIETIRKLLLEVRAAGKGVLLISEELDELTCMADRIAVFHEGMVMGVVRPQEVTIETIGVMMAGKRMAVAMSGN